MKRACQAARWNALRGWRQPPLATAHTSAALRQSFGPPGAQRHRQPWPSHLHLVHGLLQPGLGVQAEAVQGGPRLLRLLDGLQPRRPLEHGARRVSPARRGAGCDARSRVVKPNLWAVPFFTDAGGVVSSGLQQPVSMAQGHNMTVVFFLFGTTRLTKIAKWPDAKISHGRLRVSFFPKRYGCVCRYTSAHVCKYIREMYQRGQPTPPTSGDVWHWEERVLLDCRPV